MRLLLPEPLNPTRIHPSTHPCPLLQGAVFSVIGMGAGVVGTATSNGLLALRKRVDPSYATPVSACCHPRLCCAPSGREGGALRRRHSAWPLERLRRLQRPAGAPKNSARRILVTSHQ